MSFIKFSTATQQEKQREPREHQLRFWKACSVNETSEYEEWWEWEKGVWWGWIMSHIF